MAIGKRIQDLDPIGSYDIDMMKGDIIEISKNSGTPDVPVYLPGDSRRIRLDELALRIANILPYIVLIDDEGTRWKFVADRSGMQSQREQNYNFK